MLQMSRSLRQAASVQKIVMLGAGSMLFVFGAHDALFVAGYLSMQNGYLVHYASPIVALIFTAILFGRFARASRMAEELNRTLEQRIAEKSAELTSTYQRLQQLVRILRWVRWVLSGLVWLMGMVLASLLLSMALLSEWHLSERISSTSKAYIGCGIAQHDMISISLCLRI